jgi:hypothetical protein
MTCARWTPAGVLLVIATTALGAAIEAVTQQNQLLEAELRIAESPQIYFLFDLQDKKISVKARGRTLRELDVKGVRSWGKTAVVRMTRLAEKSTLFPPKRVVIEPKSNTSGEEFRVEALELKDMPATYTLVMQDRLWIYVRPEPTTVLARLWSAQYPIRWYLSRPILTVWYALWKKEPFTSVEILLDEDSARALYWSFVEGMNAIVFSPGGAA